jgi:hypothetical protein
VIFHWAARAIDVWLWLVRGLQEAWRTLPGDALGYVVMRGIGVPEPTRVVTVGDVTARVVEDPRVGRYLSTGWMPIYAQALGRYVFCRERIDDRILAHECEHIRQWRRFGPFYLPLYFGSSALAFARRRHPYDANTFEVAAKRRAELDT